MVRENKLIICKPMVYNLASDNAELIAGGWYMSRKFFVLNMHGNHPCAYISAPDFRDMNYDDVEVKYEPHGGFTYSEGYLAFADPRNSFKTQRIEEWFLGWDYAHFEDFTADDIRLGIDGEDNLLSGKKWRTEEIINECLRVIEGMPSLAESGGIRDVG